MSNIRYIVFDLVITTVYLYPKHKTKVVACGAEFIIKTIKGELHVHIKYPTADRKD